MADSSNLLTIICTTYNTCTTSFSLPLRSLIFYHSHHNTHFHVMLNKKTFSIIYKNNIHVKVFGYGWLNYQMNIDHSWTQTFAEDKFAYFTCEYSWNHSQKGLLTFHWHSCFCVLHFLYQPFHLKVNTVMSHVSSWQFSILHYTGRTKHKKNITWGVS